MNIDLILVAILFLSSLVSVDSYDAVVTIPSLRIGQPYRMYHTLLGDNTGMK